MKTYNNPTIEVVELKIDEIILTSDAVHFDNLTGEDKHNNFDWNNQ